MMTAGLTLGACASSNLESKVKQLRVRVRARARVRVRVRVRLDIRAMAMARVGHLQSNVEQLRARVS